ncbi:MAG: hypothetical protein IPP78_02590 [Holophagaceae bacterium]|nr:hypothetical protein [Holophagaceae bacterium]
MLLNNDISKGDKERLKQASRDMLAALQDHIGRMREWTKKAATQADVQVFILDNLYRSLPRPPFTEADTDTIAQRVYEYVWQQSASGRGLPTA